MTSFTMPYMIPLFLGMTFDARYTRPGVDIYDAKYVDNPLVIPRRLYVSNYKVVTDVSELLKALDISGDLSLKVKSGSLDIEGTGSYLKSDKEFEKSINILTTFDYTGVVKTFRSDAVPREGWTKDFNPMVLGSHYVSAVTYGAKIIASAKVVSYNSSNIEDIKGDVQLALQSGGSGSSLVVDGKLDKLQKLLKGKANVEISYYGTLPLVSIPNTVDGLKQLINSTSEIIKQAGLEDGIPLSVTLTSLVDIADPKDKEKFIFIKNGDLMTDLKDFEENFDDMREARNKLVTWAKSLPFDLPDEFRQEIGKLVKEIADVLSVYYNTLWKMDVTKGPDQLKSAFEAYDRLGLRKYGNLVNRLIYKVEKAVDKDAYVASDSYIHWGNSNCTGEKTKTLFDGFTFSSTEKGTGGLAQYDCAPHILEQLYEVKNEEVRSNLASIRYSKLDGSSNPFQGRYASNINGNGVPCAKCHSEDAAIVTAFPASDNCPLNSELKYRGYLMSARADYGHTTQYICVDETPSKPLPMADVKTERGTVTLTIVKSRGSLPENVYAPGALVKCAVCAMKSRSGL